MSDGFLHFILEYPLLNLINTWHQSLSPLVDIEQKDAYYASGYEKETLELPNTDWGGLVKTNYLYNNIRSSLLDGNPGRNTYWYAIGLLCSCQCNYITNGYPSYNPITTPHVRLWAKVLPSESNYYYEYRLRVLTDSYFFIFIALSFQDE